jgi:uncharacterized C2H2 Zn-finger protein
MLKLEQTQECETINITAIPTEKIQAMYQCDYCNKIYKIKNAYNRHVSVCNIMQKSKRERDYENEEGYGKLSYRELYNVVQTLAMKYDQLEKKFDKMSSWINNNKKKLNVLDWLNANKQIQTCFNQWVERLDITRDDMEYVFKYGFTEGMRFIVQRIFPITSSNSDNVPIRAFDQKDGSLFVYNVVSTSDIDANNVASLYAGEWNTINNDQFDNLFNKITKGLMCQLKFWQDENKSRLFTSGFTEIYMENVKKITGGDLTKEQQCCKFKSMLYNHIKINLKNVIQHEFEF